VRDVAQGPLSDDHPARQGFKAFTESKEYPSVFWWAGQVEHRKGSLWHAFMEGWLAAKANPIPEEPEATPTPPVDPVEEAWEMVRGWRSSDNIRAAVEATQAPLREQVQALSDRVAALEANVAHHEQSIGEQYAAVGGSATGTRLSPEAEKVLTDNLWDLYITNPNPKEVMPDGNPRPHVTPPPVAEQDAAGGDVCECAVYWPGQGHPPDCPTMQRDTRPVLTDEMVERAKEAYLQGPGSVANGIRAALLSTGLVREADHHITGEGA